MEITFENLHTAIAALEQCAKENNNKQYDTGSINTAYLCEDVAKFLKKMEASRRGLIEQEFSIKKFQSKKKFSEKYMKECYSSTWKDVAVDSMYQEMVCKMIADKIFKIEWNNDGENEILTGSCYVAVESDKNV